MPSGHTSQCKSCISIYRRNYWIRNGKEVKDKYRTGKGKEIMKKARQILRKKYNAENPQYRLKKRISSILRKSLHTNTENSTLSSYIGCSVSYFRQYIESKFVKNMSWQNPKDWHLDHIIPCKAFDLTNNIELKACFNYRNYQPLWAMDNIRKKDYYNNIDKEKYLAYITNLMNTKD